MTVASRLWPHFASFVIVLPHPQPGALSSDFLPIIVSSNCAHPGQNIRPAADDMICMVKVEIGKLENAILLFGVRRSRMANWIWSTEMDVIGFYVLHGLLDDDRPKM